MVIKTAPILILFFALAHADSDYLNPAGYPQAMLCSLSVADIYDFDRLYRGETPVQVGLTPRDPARPGKYLSPVIDGALEDSIWFYAGALGVNNWMIVNNWANASFDNCDTAQRRYFGPGDLQSVWRFVYNNEALFISCQVHDDIHFIDTARPYDRSDGIELSVDPSDWGDYDFGQWSPPVNVFRWYRYWTGQMHRYPDSSQKCFIYLQKPLNNEKKLSGLVRTQDRVFDAARAVSGYLPFTAGDAALYGIEAACSRLIDNDGYHRSVYHVEVKIPFHTGLWAELERRGYFDAKGLPLKGKRFKMNFSNNDNDNFNSATRLDTSTFIQLNTRRSHPFWEQNDSMNYRWSDTKYFPVFQFSDKMFSGVHPWPEWGVGAERTEGHGSRLQSRVAASPDPFNPVTRLTLEGAKGPVEWSVFNLQGQKIAVMNSTAPDGQARFDAAGLSSGIFIVQARSQGLVFQMKIIFQK